jgi:hypothetical protein
MRHVGLLSLLAAFLNIAVPLHAQTAGKQPWKWTASERLKKRLDPASMQLRTSRAQARMSASGSNGFGGTGDFVIVGETDPELFLPWELMDTFLSEIGGDANHQLRMRRAFQRWIGPLGVDDQKFWRTIEQLSTHYAAARERSITLQMKLRNGETKTTLAHEVELTNREICSARIDALEGARAAFGVENFDRFLYTAVAPHVVIRSSVPTDATALLWSSEGCR